MEEQTPNFLLPNLDLNPGGALGGIVGFASILGLAVFGGEGMHLVVTGLVLPVAWVLARVGNSLWRRVFPGRTVPSTDAPNPDALAPEDSRSPTEEF